MHLPELEVIQRVEIIRIYEVLAEEVSILMWEEERLAGNYEVAAFGFF